MDHRLIRLMSTPLVLHQSKPNKEEVFTQDVYSWKVIDWNEISSSPLKCYLSIWLKWELARLSVAGKAFLAIIIKIWVFWEAVTVTKLPRDVETLAVNWKSKIYIWNSLIKGYLLCYTRVCQGYLLCKMYTSEICLNRINCICNANVTL